MNVEVLKQKIRQDLPPSDLLPNKYGKLAEQIRGIDCYRKANQIFISPSEVLIQARINALLDQKELIMPSGSLKRGFVRFKPNTIPFNKLGKAVTFQGMDKYGEILPSSLLAGCDIALFLIDSEMVDSKGGRLGSGMGFSDLSLALLTEYGAFSEAGQVFSAVAENRVVVDLLPAASWDIKLDGFVTNVGATQCTAPKGKHHKIYWSDLSKKRVKKIQPLWDLFKKNNPAP